MQIIISMSGLGRRFQAEGYTEPKPLITVDGRPMIEWVVKLFPGETNFLFTCLKDHLETTPMVDTLRRIAPRGRIFEIPRRVLGPVANVLAAAELINDDEPVIVNYCDFYAHWDYPKFKRFVTETGADGALPCYWGFHPHLLVPTNFYASCRVDEQNRLLEIKEKHSFTKDKMASPQSAGSHYFKSGRLLKKYCQRLVDEEIQLNGEYYCSLLYNLLVRDGLTTYITPMERFCQWGTPADLADFNRWLAYVRAKAQQGPLVESPSDLTDDELKTYHYWRAYFQKEYAQPMITV